MLSKENMNVLTNVIGAVESGGQVYGKRRYDAYAPAYANTPNEHTCTLGWAQNYGAEAKKLVQLIYDKDPTAFKKIDTNSSIQKRLKTDWVADKWNPNASDRAKLIKLIDSSVGHEAQDELFAELMTKFIADCENQYTKDVKAIMMYCEIRHLGGRGPTDRIFKRCNGDYSLSRIMWALNQDDPNSNQVGSRKFRSRHEKCIEFIERYAKDDRILTTIVDEFSKYIGVHEYNGIVAVIQKWYYGALVKDAWCATSTSYFANVAGVLSQLGGKNEGVSEMMAATRRLHQTDGRFFEYPKIPKELKKNDIVFFKRNGASHVAHVWKDTEYTGSGYINVLGGNQSDMICKKDYKQANIQAIYRPYYTEGEKYMFTVKSIQKNDTGADVLLLQKLLKGMGYKQTNGKELSLTKRFGTQTEAAVKAFQKANKLETDGIVGPKTWAKLLGV